MLITFKYDMPHYDMQDGEFYTIKFNKDKLKDILHDITDDFDGVSWNAVNHKKEYMCNLDQYILKLKYRGKSRIDSLCIFQLDTLKYERSEKIKKILCQI